MRVSVLVRDEAKLEAELGKDILAKLSKITVGDGTDAKVLNKAMSRIDAVLSGRGGDPHLAREMAAAAKRNGVKKLCWPGGTTNVLADDGVTPNYKKLLHLGSWVEDAYRAHGACIDAIRQANLNYVIFCPGRMASVGRRSPNVRTSVRVNRDAGLFVSYEDAAWVMLEATTTSAYDRQLVSAATQR
jgi:putative NADH-flavin reductase